MNIKKATEALTGGVPTEAQLGAINAQARAKLTPEQVYVFSLRLCDDQIDRDGERFDTAALSGLAKLFIGKTGILDHRWSSDSQVARIFATEVVREERVSYIKAWAYIRRGGAAGWHQKGGIRWVRHGTGGMLDLRQRLRYLRPSKGRILQRTVVLRHSEGADGCL